MLTGVPTLGAADLGQAEWERLIIRELRTRHYAWRTEQAYREWAKRFVRWLEARGGRWEQATHPEVKEFLSDLGKTNGVRSILLTE